MLKSLLIANRGKMARALLPLSLAERGQGVRGVQPPRRQTNALESNTCGIGLRG